MHNCRSFLWQSLASLQCYVAGHLGSPNGLCDNRHALRTSFQTFHAPTAAQPRANPVFAAHSVSSRRAPHLQAESRQTNPNGGAPPVIRAVLAELCEITIGTGMLGMLVIFVYQG